MYYHVIVELGAKYHKDVWDQVEIKSDVNSLEDIKLRFTEPYQLGESILINGRSIEIEKIERMRIFSSETSSDVLKQREKARRDSIQRSSSIVAIGFYHNDLETAILKEKEITDELITYPKGKKKRQETDSNNSVMPKPSKVFIVHGHDDPLINEVKAFLLSQSIEPIVLREQHDASLTIIEKLEQYTSDPAIGFGIVLYTPDDEGKGIKEPEYRLRARQNVVFEHGLLIGLYTRSRVTCLVKKEGFLEMPGDVNGVVYTDHAYNDWRLSVAHMLNKSGYDIDYSKIR